MAHASVVVQDMARFGPGAQPARPLSLAESRAYCHRFTRMHSENFSVLSALVPRRCRDDFAVLYAFCRWADDLSDEFSSPDESLALLRWWRGELHAAFASDGPVTHPVFVALAEAVTRLGLERDPFDALLAAFEQDQAVSRYVTWNSLLDYCALSANPVGRLVLRVLGEPCHEEQLAASDAICTALQLTNHWQDIRRDFQARNRIYAPQEIYDGELRIPDFERRLRETTAQGFACDGEFLEESRRLVAVLVDRTWPFYERGASLIACAQRESRPLIGLFAAGGSRTLRKIELWNFETILHRPRMLAIEKCWLVACAYARHWGREGRAC